MNTKDRTIAFAMFLAGICCYGLLYYYQPVLPLLADSFGLSAAESSFAVSFSTLGMTVGLLSGMFFADMIGRKKLISSTLFLGAFLALASSFATSFWELILACAFKGYFLAGTASVSLAYINEEVAENSKSRVTGIYIAGGALGGMSARVGAAYLGSAYSWMWASIVVATMAIVLALIIFWKSPYSTCFTPQRKTFKVLIVDNVHLLCDRQLLAYCSIGAVMIGIFVSLYNYISFLLLAPPFDLEHFYISKIYYLFVFGLLGSVLTYRLLRRLSPLHLLQILLSTTILGLVLLFVQTLLTIVLGLIFVTISFFITHVACSYVVSNLKPSHRSIAISVYLLLYYISSSFLGSATGLLIDHWNWSFFVAVLIFFVLVLLVVSVWIGRYEKRLRENSK